MNLTLMPAAMAWPGGKGEGEGCQYLSTCLVNGTLALDAGCLGYLGTPEEQAAIDHVFLTHAHLDHVASLPIWLENIYDLRATPPTVHATSEVLDVLQRDLFNDRVWPDFIALSQQVRPFVTLAPLEPNRPRSVAGLKVEAIPVTHVVPTVGYLLSDHQGSIAFIPDTGPTDAIWAAAAARKDLRAVVVETTFPNELSWLADVSRHLTPALLVAELAKLGRAVPVYIMHLKARYRAAVREQLAALRMPNLTILVPGQEVRL